MSKIFFSHAAKDKPVVDLLVNTFLLSCGLQSQDVFYTSIGSLGCEEGKPFTPEIKRNLKESKVLIAYLSKNYRASEYCMAELGATLINEDKLFIPLLDDELDKDFFKGVLTGITLMKINDDSSLFDAIERILNFLEKNIKGLSWIQKQVNYFLEHYPEEKQKIPVAFCCNEETFNEVGKQLNKYKAICEEQASIINENEKLIEALKKAKNSEDVHMAVIEACSDEKKQFEMAVEDVHNSSKKINCFVEKNVIYDYFGVDPCYDIREYADEYNEAKNDGYMVYNEDYERYDVNYNDRQVKKVRESLKNFEIVYGNLSPSFVSAMEDEYDVDFDLSKATCLKKIFDL